MAVHGAMMLNEQRYRVHSKKLLATHLSGNDPRQPLQGASSQPNQDAITQHAGQTVMMSSLGYPPLPERACWP
jgi:hypothetical protein